MRLIAVLPVAICGLGAKNPQIFPWTGVWVSYSPKCNPGVSNCDHIILNVKQDRNDLKIIEILRAHDGASVDERLYSLKEERPGMGIVKVTGHRVRLRYFNRNEQWAVSKDGIRLTVDRWIGVKSKESRQVLIFRRSTGTVE